MGGKGYGGVQGNTEIWEVENTYAFTCLTYLWYFHISYVRYPGNHTNCLINLK